MKDEIVRLRVSEDQKQLWREEAEEDPSAPSLSEWARSTLDFFARAERRKRLLGGLSEGDTVFLSAAPRSVGLAGEVSIGDPFTVVDPPDDDDVLTAIPAEGDGEAYRLEVRQIRLSNGRR